MFFMGLGKLFSRSKPVTPVEKTLQMQRQEKMAEVTAAYDAAQTTDYNVRHWRNADDLSADTANSAAVRRELRMRSRYEAHEANSFLKGIISTLANDCIGTGPRLQVMTADREANAQIERAFAGWARQSQLAEKLRTMRTAKAVDGEAFALMTTNRRLKHPIQLDLKLIEAEEVATPFTRQFSPNQIDGIVLDDFGNPLEYHLLKSHPGDYDASYRVNDYETVDADDMLHMFRCDRPGQHRGVPETTTSLPLCAILRDFTLAVLSTARSAAKLTAVIETDSGAVTDDGSSWDQDVESFDAVDIDYDMMTSLPHGWRMKQFKAEQPATTYEMFRNANINEIGRPWNMPLNVALGNSAGYNYASGRLDHQTYFKSINVERSQWECNVLDRILMVWFDEAALIPELLPDGLGLIADLPHRWVWPGREHVDPAKEANAQSVRLASNTTTLAEEYARDGKDWEEEIRQRAKEQELMRELGIPISGGPSPSAEEPDDEETEETTEAATAAA